MVKKYKKDLPADLWTEDIAQVKMEPLKANPPDPQFIPNPAFDPKINWKRKQWDNLVKEKWKPAPEPQENNALLRKLLAAAYEYKRLWEYGELYDVAEVGQTLDEVERFLAAAEGKHHILQVDHPHILQVDHPVGQPLQEVITEQGRRIHSLAEDVLFFAGRTNNIEAAIRELIRMLVAEYPPTALEAIIKELNKE